MTHGGDASAAARGIHPTVPAYLALLSCAVGTSLLLPWPAALTPLVWVLLGVTAGYSLSGSV